MGDDYERCGREGPGGVRCSMPAGHGGKEHGAEFNVPPDLGRLIEQHLERAEAAQAAYVKARRWLRVAFWGVGIAIVANLGSAIVNVLRALS